MRLSKSINGGQPKNLSRRWTACERGGAVKRALFSLFAFVVASAFAKSTEAPEVAFVSPCECQGFHGKNRWVAKTDLTPVPSNKAAIQSVTPSQIYAWEGLGPNVELTGTTEERIPTEQKWYALGALFTQKWKRTATFI
jgi:hypothetical protein